MVNIYVLKQAAGAPPFAVCDAIDG